MPQQGSTWVVDSGDNVFKIAEQVYGNQRMAFEILKMNGGSTLVHPGDVLSLPEWNDPNVYVGANQMQGVLNQRIANDPNYTGPTVAAVPDSQKAAWGAEQGLTGFSTTSTTTPTTSTTTPTALSRQAAQESRLSIPNQYQNPAYIPRPNISYPGGVPNARREAGAAQGATAVQAPNTANPEIARAQRYQASGVPGSTLATQPRQAALSTSPMAMAGGNIGSLFSSLTGKNLNTATAKNLINPLYSSAVQSLQTPQGTTGKKPVTTPTISTEENQKFLQQEVQNLSQYINSGGVGTPPQSVAGAAASNVLGYQYDKKMASLGYVYDTQARRFVLVNQVAKPTDNSGLPYAPTSFQGVGQDWNASHNPQVAFEYAGLDRGGGGAGGGVTGRTGTTAGSVALSTRVATG